VQALFRATTGKGGERPNPRSTTKVLFTSWPPHRSLIRPPQGSSGMMLAESPSGGGQRLLSSGPERDEWNHGLIVGSGSAAEPNSAATRADGATRRAASGAVATLYQTE